MSAPRSIHRSAQRRVALIVEREYQPDPARCVAAIVKLLTYRPADPPGDRDSADPRRPLGAGDRPAMHEDRTSAGKQDGAAFAGDDRHEPSTDV